jgi:hypothetical protein
MTPYRKPPEEDAPRPARTLDCVIETGDRQDAFKVVAVKAVAIILAVTFGQLIHIGVAIAFGLLGIVWIVWDLLRRGAGHLRIHVEGERVSFGLPQPLDVSFAKLLDVRLDTKTTTKALNHARADGLNSIFGPIIPDGRSIQVDQSRIVLVIKGRDPVLLTQARVSSTLAHENIREIKVFLRKSGWLPADERPLEDRPKKKKKKKEEPRNAM